jgi:DNA primase/KaiC/GvpD/RAD55 family RecA-like ATPase
MARDTSFFDQIKREIPLEDYLTNHLGVELVSDGPGRLKACCPFHDEDTPSFKVSESDEGWKRWHCFGACSEGGTIIDACMRAEGFEDAFEAAAHLNELYELGLEHNSEAWKRFKKTVEETRAEVKQGREAIKKDAKIAKVARDYLHSRGFSDETIDYFQLGLDERRYRLTIPLVDKANHEVSIANRALFDSVACATCRQQVTAKEVRRRKFEHEKLTAKGETPGFEWDSCPRCNAKGKDAKIKFLAWQDPKYLYARDFDKAEFLYHQLGARRALNDREHKDEIRGIYVVEGYADVWAGWQAGHKAIVATNGAVLSDWQAEQVASMAAAADKPAILVPDFDSTGRINVENNYRKLRAANPNVIVQVVHSLDDNEGGDDGKPPCKDLADVLKHHGEEKVFRVMVERRWPVEEWLIREIIGRKNPKTGEPYHDKVRQMQLVREVLSNVNDRIALDQVIPLLAEAWKIREKDAHGWFYSNLSPADVVSAQHLLKSPWQAEWEALEFQADDNVIPIGYEAIDRCLPGGGARKGWLSMFIGKSGTGKTMLSTAILANMAQHGIRAIMFSLEQKAGALWERMARQVLDIDQQELHELMSGLWERIKDEPMPSDESALRRLLDENCPELAKVNELHKNLYIVDNVPSGDMKALDMTPGRIESIIREVNTTKFEGRPADVVVIDHLGILKVPEDAPLDVRSNDLAAPGYIMQELFEVCKATDVFMMVLQQLPKEIKPGVPFDYDAGRGGSKQTDYCDLIFQIWRPDQQADLDDVERESLAGVYMLKLGKNRHGGSVTAELFFDTHSLRIIPRSWVEMPTRDIEAGEDDDAAVDISPADAADNGQQGRDRADAGSPDGGAKEAGDMPLEDAAAITIKPPSLIESDESEPEPKDTKELLAALGAELEDSDTDAGGLAIDTNELESWFNS